MTKKITKTADIQEFQKIVSVLNRYYALSNHAKSPAIEFRERLVLTSPTDLEIEIKKMGNHEFYVSAKILSEGKIENWLHIDGILQERETMTERGNLNHPVFKITCLSDLYENAEIVKDKVKKEKVKKKNETN
jgi:hypothetical protein